MSTEESVKTEERVGRVSVEFEVANNDDVVGARLGNIPMSSIRRETIRGLVDPGATRLVLPGALVERLGLRAGAQVKVQYADGRTEMRDRVDGVHAEIQGRGGVFSAIVEPRRTEALIGAIVLEDLDFLVDCAQQKLIPRDPAYIVSEIE